ncbi:MAG: RNA 2',3'-cyclic phosphodiesterase [Minisyncoccia bacterium]|jgi:2'-5' RNA ligase
MKRLFFAIKFNQDFIRKISCYQEKLKGDYLRIISPENLHLTLLFLGEIEDCYLKDIEQIANKATQQANFKTIFLKLKRIEYGTNPSRPRLIWITGEQNKELIKLYHLLKHSLKSFILKEDHFDFIPHITIARFNRFFTKEQLPSLPSPSFFENKILTINSFYLMESKLSYQKGAEYFELKKYQL